VPISKHVEDLIESHIGLANSLAVQVWKTAPHSLEYDEMRSLAFLGLIHAASLWDDYCARREFDPTATQYFTTYAKKRMYGCIYDNLRSVDWATRSRRTKAKQIQQADQGMGLSEEDIAEKTGLTIDEVHSTIAFMAKKPVSFDAGIAEMYEPRITDVASTAESNSLLDTAVDAIKECTFDQQIILALHYYQDMELQDVASLMGISPAKASQLHAAAVLLLFDTVKGAASDVKG
jgi:RNA polymerase sigma factor FliA